MKRADWDRLADDFETETCDITREESADLTERFVSLARIPKRKAVLVDLGCGVGTFIHRFGGRFGEIFGVEFAPRIIARARKRCADMQNVDLAQQRHSASPPGRSARRPISPSA